MSGHRVLLVDDEPDVLQMLKVVLTSKGHSVAEATTGMEALTRAHEEQPDLILLDIMMEEMDGWEVLKLLKMEEGTRDIPVVMVSARVEPRDKIRGLQEGAVDYLTKPFSVQQVLETIELVLGPGGAGPDDRS